MNRDIKMTLYRFILTNILIVCLAVQVMPVKANQANEITFTSDCAFGYSLQIPQFQWIDIKSTGTKINFSPQDDGIFHLLNIGFNFPFFENSYSDVFVSTNGFLAFGQQNENAYPANFAIPAEFSPNNLVAGFWNDLTVGGNYNSGSAYYQISGDSPN